MQAISYQAFKHFYEYSNEKLGYRDFHFKAFGMINLHYVIRICQKIYTRGRKFGRNPKCDRNWCENEIKKN